MLDGLTILDVEHLIDETVSTLLRDLASTGKADEDVQFIRTHTDVTLTRLYIAGLKAGLCLYYNFDGDLYHFGGSEREAVKQLVFRYCNEKLSQGGRGERVKYREKYKEIGGNEAYFTKWIVPHPDRRPSPTLRPFFKLVTWLDVPVSWGRKPETKPREGGGGRGVVGTSEKGSQSKVARSRSTITPVFGIGDIDIVGGLIP